MTFEEAKKHKQTLEQLIDTYSSKLNSFQKNELGLIPDHIRETKEYKEVKSKYETLFNKLRDFNIWYVKNFKKEISKERKNRYRKKSVS